MQKSKPFMMAVLITGLLGISQVYAQESVNASGGDATGSGGSAAYSIGQVVYTTETGSTGSIAQGVQHPYEIFILDIGSSTNPVSFNMSVYPNPATDKLILQSGEASNKHLNYMLCDINGKVLKTENIAKNETDIDLKNMPASTYFVYVVNQKNEKVKAFKIIKN